MVTDSPSALGAVAVLAVLRRQCIDKGWTAGESCFRCVYRSTCLGWAAADPVAPHRVHGCDPRYDVKFLPVLHRLGWLAAEDLEEEVGRRPLWWFKPDATRTGLWLESARRRRIIEQNPSRNEEWGLTDRGESGIPSVRLRELRLRELLPFFGLALAAAGFASADDRVDLDLVVPLLIFAFLEILSAALAAGGWQLLGRPLTFVAWLLEYNNHGPQVSLQPAHERPTEDEALEHLEHGAVAAFAHGPLCASPRGTCVAADRAEATTSVRASGGTLDIRAR